MPKFAIPKASIEWIMQRVHVSTSDDDVRADIRRRCAGKGLTQKQVGKCEEYAISQHRKNQALYRFVVSAKQ